MTSGPSSGLLTASASVGEGNTADVTVKFASPETIGGTPTVTLSNGTVCPYSKGSGTANIVFHCTVGSGQNTPVGLSASNPGMYGTYLATAATKTLQLNGGSIVDGACEDCGRVPAGENLIGVEAPAATAPTRSTSSRRTRPRGTTSSSIKVTVAVGQGAAKRIPATRGSSS